MYSGVGDFLSRDSMGLSCRDEYGLEFEVYSSRIGYRRSAS